MDTTSLLKSDFLKLPWHTGRFGSRRLPRNPIACGCRRRPQTQKIFPHPAQHPAERSENQIEKNAQNDRITNFVERDPECGPTPVQWSENSRRQNRRDQEDCAARERPPAPPV